MTALWIASSLAVKFLELDPDTVPGVLIADAHNSVPYFLWPLASLLSLVPKSGREPTPTFPLLCHALLLLAWTVNFSYGTWHEVLLQPVLNMKILMWATIPWFYYEATQRNSAGGVLEDEVSKTGKLYDRHGATRHVDMEESE